MLEEKSDLLLDYFGIEITLQGSVPNSQRNKKNSSAPSGGDTTNNDSPNKEDVVMTEETNEESELVGLPIIIPGIKPFP